jgi:hypothetical protein
MVGTAARDALAWLQEPDVADVNERLRSIEDSLRTQAKCLDEPRICCGAEICSPAVVKRF